MEEELRLIVRVALAEGDLDTAAARAAELVAHVRGRGTAAEADALPVLARVAQAAGDAARAAALYREALRLARRLPDPGEAHPVLYRDTNDPPGVALALEGTAALVAPDQPALALRLGAAAADLRERTRQPLTPGEQEALDRWLAGAARPARPRRGGAVAGGGGRAPRRRRSPWPWARSRRSRRRRPGPRRRRPVFSPSAGPLHAACKRRPDRRPRVGR